MNIIYIYLDILLAITGWIIVGTHGRTMDNYTTHLIAHGALFVSMCVRIKPTFLQSYYN